MSKIREVARRCVPPVLLDLYRSARDGRPSVDLPVPYAGFKLPERSLTAAFPAVAGVTVEVPATEIIRRRNMVMPHAELLAIAAVCRALAPRRVFEIGTYTGSTTLMMALNAPAETELLTLDLEPAADVPAAPGTPAEPAFRPGAAFAGTAAAAKIRQLYGDSRTFDYGPFEGTCDVVLVDACHEYDFVKADTATAFRLVRPGGVVIWDDYLWEPQWPECEGVARCLDELIGTRDVFLIAGTRLAAYVDGRGSR
jgi:predicted O-methyltransferase YrrM